jgi:carbamoyltransferase
MFDNFPFIVDDEAPIDIPTEHTIDLIAKFLLNGKTVGWYQGHGEAGPRALGNRSILFNPLISNGKEIVNAIKKRENYRPFGAVVLREYAHEYFDIDGEDPYMLFMGIVLDKRLKSITHVDNTCRIQTLDKENLLLRQLLEKFKEYSGVPILLNTSLNVAGRPIAGSIGDAIELFETSILDILVFGNTVKVK